MTYVLPATHMKDVLVSNGYVFGGSLPWGVWIGKKPEAPAHDRAIVFYDAPGGAPDPKWLLDFPSVQVRVRGGPNDYEAASIKAKEVQGLLVGRESYDASNGDRIVSILGMGDVSFDGWDDKSRPEFILNLSLIIEPSPLNIPTQREPLPG